MMFILKAITREIATISLFVRTIATAFFALGMGMAMAQVANLSLIPAHQDVTNGAGSADFAVTTNVPLGDLTVTVTADSVWTEATANAAWSVRSNHASVVFDNKMWVIGGFGGSYQNDVWSSTDGITWTQATANAGWSERSNHTSVVYDDKMWVMGGYNGSSQNDVWSSPDGITWTEVERIGTGWSKRSSHTSVVFDDKMWVIGGFGGDLQNDVWHSPDGATWTQATAAAAWSIRNEHTSVVFGGKIWVIGGSAGSNLDDVWHSTDGITWTEATTTGTTWSARDNHASVVYDEKMWVIGGDDGSPQNDVWSSTDGITWTQATDDVTWSARSSHTSVAFDGKMWVIGGLAGSRQDDVWFFGEWLTASLSGSSSPYTLTATYEAKIEVAAPRTGTLTVSGRGLSEAVTVRQGAELALSPVTQSVTAEAGSTSFTLTTNLPAVMFDVIEDWLRVSRVIGTTLSVNYEANEVAAPRTGTLAVSGEGLTAMATVTQAGAVPELALSPAHRDVTAEAGSTNFTVTTNVPSGDLTITDDADWLTTERSGTTLTADYEANSMAAPRTGTVTVSGGGLTEMVTVTQAGADPELALSPANRDVTAETGSTNFTVTTNVPSGDLTITDDADWLTVSLSGTTLTADYEANGIIDVPRTGTVTVSGGGLTEMVTVTQAGAIPELALSPATQSVTSEAGSTSFTVTTNIVASELTITTDTWTQATNDAAWSARNNHTSVVFDNKMWVIGGGTDGPVKNDVWHSTDGITWTQSTADAPWSARWLHTSVVFDNKIWVIGGAENFLTSSLLADVWSSTDGITWTQTVADAPWSARRDHTSVVFDNKMWVIGGDEGFNSRQNDVWHSTDGITWTQATTDAPWSGRSSHTSVVFDNNIWVIGGYDGSNQDDVWHSTDGITWTQATTDAPWAARNNHTSVVFDNKIWVIGGSEFTGSSNNLYGDIWHSTDGVTWTQATDDVAWSARTWYTSVVYENKIWVIGGYDGSNQDDVYFSGEWLAASLSGTTLTADYEVNSIAAPRTGTVTVSGGGLTEMVTVTQAGADPELALSPANRDVTAETGSTNFTVTTNVPSGDLTITDDADWLTVSLSGTTLTADYEANSIVDVPRTGTVTVSGGGLTEMVTVTQAGAIPELALSPATQSVTSEAGSTSFTVTTNLPSGDLTITDDADWLTTELSGTTLTADYEANSIAAHRTGTVTVSGNGLAQTVTVVQAETGVTFELALSPAMQSVTNEAGSTSFTVTTNVPSGDLTITDNADWLTVSLSGTSSPYTLTADYEANSDTSPRTGTVTVSGGGLTRTVTVVQAETGVTFELVLSPAVQSVTNEAGTTDFTVTTNVPSDALTTTDDAAWLTVGLSGSSSPYTSTADYEANSDTSPRTGTVTVSGGGLTRTVTVTQAAFVPELSLSPATQSVTSEAGSTDFTVTTNVPSGDLTITDDADWLTVSLSGTTLTADYEANSSTLPRTGTMTVSGGGLTRTVTVTQAAFVPELSLSPATQSVTSEAGSTDFTVTTNVPSGDLTITDDADWLTVSLSGTTLTADYEANSSTLPRTGTMTVSGGGLTETVTVTQAGAAPELALSPANRDITAEAGSTDFTVTTNLPADALTTTDDADWLTVSLSGTSSPYTLTADYEANGDTSPRTGTVTVSGGGLTETVTVEQEGTPLGLEDETALVVYPNPGVAQVTVDFGDMAQGEGKAWTLLDSSGKNMRSGWVARGEATLVINTQGLLSGLYLFQVRGEGQKSYISHRVVIRH